jgi:hypothetical protein
MSKPHSERQLSARRHTQHRGAACRVYTGHAPRDRLPAGTPDRGRGLGSTLFCCPRWGSGW